MVNDAEFNTYDWDTLNERTPEELIEIRNEMHDDLATLRHNKHIVIGQILFLQKERKKLLALRNI